jgi:fumarylacetoacetase
VTASAAETYSAPGYGVENLPYGSFAPDGEDPRLGVRLGNVVIDVRGLLNGSGAFGAPGRGRTVSAEALAAVAGTNLDRLLAAGRPIWREVRAEISELVTSLSAREIAPNVHPLAEVALFLPFTVADYVDFYASENHAINAGRLFRPGQAPLTPNWKHLPIGYHGRAGTIVPSGTPVVRPSGLRPEPDGTPSFGPSRRLDIEAEIGFVVGGAAPSGRVPLSHASEHLFGVVAVNDWSARDLQAFEYVPLGPFLGKSFATSISHWVVPFEALQHARVPSGPRDVAVAEYLDDTSAEPGGLDIVLEVALDGEVISRPPFAGMYWTSAQMLAHITVNGASLRPGDFFASGTVSGPLASQMGSLLELTWGGAEPLRLASGQEVGFLNDGHEIVIRAEAPGPNGTRISLGEVSGRIIGREEQR